MNPSSAWLRLWYVWAVPALVAVLNLVWMAQVRGKVLGRGPLLTRQVQDAEAQVGRLDGQLRQLEAAAAGLTRLQENLVELRRQQLAPMRERLIPFLTDVVKRTQEAGLQPERISYTAQRDEKSGLVYFSATYALTGGYEKIRRCVHLLESSPQFIVIQSFGLQGQAAPTTSDVTVQLTLGTYFADFDEALLKQLGVDAGSGGA